VSLQKLAAVTQERQDACGLPIGDLRGFGRVRADASVVHLALDRDAGLLCPPDAARPLLGLVLGGDPVWASAYVPGTNVLESTARTSSGELRVVDFMALAEGRPGQAESIAAGRFGRIVTCTEGEVACDLACVREAGHPTEARRRKGWHVACSHPLSQADGVATLSMRLTAGESVALVVSENAMPAGVSLVAAALHALGDTIHYWTWWSDRCRYQGEDAEAALREALRLKLGCSALGLQVEDPGATGFAPAPLGDTVRAAARFLELGYRHECAELLTRVHERAASSAHERWKCDASFTETVGRYLAKYGDAGLPGNLCATAHVPPPQSRSA
jgi:hypothetical protein